MAEDLTQWIEELGPPHFRSAPAYSSDGDYLTFFFEDEDHYGERIDELLTVYRSAIDDRLVGCKIKGVRRILRDAGKFGVRLRTAGAATLSFLFLTGGLAKEGSARQCYEELGIRTSEVDLPLELAGAA